MFLSQFNPYARVAPSQPAQASLPQMLQQAQGMQRGGGMMPPPPAAAPQMPGQQPNSMPQMTNSLLDQMMKMKQMQMMQQRQGAGGQQQRFGNGWNDGTQQGMADYANAGNPGMAPPMPMGGTGWNTGGGDPYGQ